MGKFYTLILCDGEPPSEFLFRSHFKCCNLCIATDGAAETALHYGVTPDVAIGDMDSFNPPPGYPGTIIRNTDQESNDLEKALIYAIEQGSEEVIVLGATGRRLDHTLKNLSVFRRFIHDF
ncbi:MAG: thiamine diphosphokinase, partial [Balneolales bacterium]